MTQRLSRYFRYCLPMLFLFTWLLHTHIASADAVLSDGYFYMETGGQTNEGFAIENGPAGQFWSSFQALGGVSALGYPVSLPYIQGGLTYQAVQGGLLQWRPDLGRAVLANTFEMLSAAGDDALLYHDAQIPYPIANDGSNGNFQRAVAIRLSWLTDPAIKRHYLANPNPAIFHNWTTADAIQLYGLPMSKPQSFGTFIAQRFQRVVFQHWLQSVPGMPAPGSVVRVLGGDLAKRYGLVPAAAQQPETVETALSTPQIALNPATTYTVQAGDSLWTISQHFGVTLDALAQANNLTAPYTLLVGQVLQIPSNSALSSPTTATTQPSADPPPTPPPSAISRAGTIFYTIQAGDSLWTISQHFGVTLDALAQANNLTPPYSLIPGQTLQIPTTGSTVAAPTNQQYEQTTFSAPAIPTTDAIPTSGGTGDLLHNIPIVSEQALNNAACGIAAATMVLDYYVQATAARSTLPNLHAVADYVKQYYFSGLATDPAGTTFAQLQNGLQQASSAAGVQILATWSTTSPSSWLTTLTYLLNQHIPVIVYLPDGGIFWNNAWHYGHYVVVSGYTGSHQIWYHDPWDGRAHLVSAQAFASAWGLHFLHNPTWRYLYLNPQFYLPR